jgi:hypothetical protein
LNIGDLIRHAPWGSILPWVGAVVGLGGFLGLSVNVRALYGATPFGRRRHLSRQLAKIGCGVRVGYVSGLLGPPAFVTSPPGPRQGRVTANQLESQPQEIEPLTEVVYVHEDAFVQLLVGGQGGSLDDRPVRVYAVTTRHKRFRPRLTFQYFHVFEDRYGRPVLRLGHTTFEELSDRINWLPQVLCGWQGARRVAWAESYYLGNPGGYQTYVVARNDAGVGKWGASFPRREGEGSRDWISGAFARSGHIGPTGDLDHPEVAAWRRQMAINTYAVLDPNVSLQSVVAWG